MTDESERRTDGVSDEDVKAGDAAATDTATDNTGTAGDTNDPIGDAEPPVDFGELSLPQRVFVASVQNPTRGVVLVGLLAFAFSFYIALWLVFARVAAFLSVVGLVLVGIVVAVYVLSDRLS